MSITQLIIGHGSRNPRSNGEFERFVKMYQVQHPNLRIRHAYLELAQPRLPQALDQAAHISNTVCLLPLFLFASGHIKNDLPLAVADLSKRYPAVRWKIGRPLGTHPLLIDILVDRLRNVPPEPPCQETVVLVVGRGSSDPDANGDFCKLVRLLTESVPGLQALPAFAGISPPLVDEGLELLLRSRPKRLIILPYMLFAGKLVERLQVSADRYRAQYPWVRFDVAPPLGLDPRLFRIFQERAEGALTGTDALPCESCQYRAPLGEITEQVGGMRALLYSIRHSLTHAQASNHDHAHRPVRQHLLICGNADCAQRGSLTTLAEVRRAIKKLGLHKEIKVTRTSCMGQCGEGPALVVYPDGVWYRKVTPDKVTNLVRAHLINEQLVDELVDHIMT